MNPPKRFTISCDECVRQSTADCDDCVVTFVLDADGGSRRDADALVIDIDDARVMSWMREAGLIPELKFDRVG